jgi:hypothetical protein
VSGEHPPEHTNFVSKVLQYNQNGHGLCLFADNAPWFKTVNPIMEALFNVSYTYRVEAYKLVGDFGWKHSWGQSNATWQAAATSAIWSTSHHHRYTKPF